MKKDSCHIKAMKRPSLENKCSKTLDPLYQEKLNSNSF